MTDRRPAPPMALADDLPELTYGDWYSDLMRRLLGNPAIGGLRFRPVFAKLGPNIQEGGIWSLGAVAEWSGGALLLAGEVTTLYPTLAEARADVRRWEEHERQAEAEASKVTALIMTEVKHLAPED